MRSRSTCLRVPAGIGAVLVRDNHLLTTGYAGSVRGQPHCAGREIPDAELIVPADGREFLPVWGEGDRVDPLLLGE
jgi:deoxycytidylate deaminase